MGYIPPAFSLEQLKQALPGRINYYTVKMYIHISGEEIQIEFIKDNVIRYIMTCEKEKKQCR